MSTHQPTIFNQIFSLIKHEISPLIGQLDQHARKFDTQSLFKVLMFAQSTGRQSLREIETALQANDGKIYHMGLKSIARSTISYWNSKTDSSTYEKLFYRTCLNTLAILKYKFRTILGNTQATLQKSNINGFNLFYQL